MQSSKQKLKPPYTPSRIAPTRVRRINRPGMRLVELELAGVRELHLTITPLPDEPVQTFALRMVKVLKKHNSSPVNQFVFAPVRLRSDLLTVLRTGFGRIGWPISWIESPDAGTAQLAGAQVRAVSGRAVQPVIQDGHIVGCTFEDDFSRHCFFGNLHPDSAFASEPEQAARTFELFETALRLADMQMNNVVRTWFFLDNIIDWYARFNAVRSGFYARRFAGDAPLPASTGVGAKNPHQTALLAGAWALKPHDSTVCIHEVPSPAQCAATRYGSAFSRAIEIVEPRGRRLIVSGTASVGLDGQTMHIGNTAQQIKLTMNAVEAILHSRGMSFNNVTRAVAYFKHMHDVALFADWAKQTGHTDLPILLTCADLCRADLLFEIELDAFSCAS